MIRSNCLNLWGIEDTFAQTELKTKVKEQKIWLHNCFEVYGTQYNLGVHVVFIGCIMSLQ